MNEADKKASLAGKKLGLGPKGLKELQQVALLVWTQLEGDVAQEVDRITANDAIEITLDAGYIELYGGKMSPQVKKAFSMDSDYEALKAALKPVFRELYG